MYHIFTTRQTAEDWVKGQWAIGVEWVHTCCNTQNEATQRELLSKVHNFPLHYTRSFLPFISSTTTWHAAMLVSRFSYMWTKFKHMFLLGNSTAQTPDIVLILKTPRRVPHWTRSDAFSVLIYSNVYDVWSRAILFCFHLSRVKKCRRLCIYVSRRWFRGVAT